MAWSSCDNSVSIGANELVMYNLFTCMNSCRFICACLHVNFTALCVYSHVLIFVQSGVLNCSHYRFQGYAHTHMYAHIHA